MRSTAVAAATGSRFRARKLNTKTSLLIVKETDIDAAPEPDPLGRDGPDALASSLPKVETGVESKEEQEHHLQAVINASNAAIVGGSVAQISIPTPDAVPTNAIKYDELYARVFVQPATYIRSSATVEDSTGVPYCMNDEDDVFLVAFNEKHDPKCSEDEFEQLMSSFEETSMQRQPYAAVDQTPVLTLDELETAFDDMVSEGARRFAADVYAYWKDQKQQHTNQSLMPRLKTLKMETGQEADDSDPYVCFRRREVRQARKTRGRDAQVVEKLKKLRRELEEARQIVFLVREREQARKQDLQMSRKLFDQRTAVREMKRSLNIQDDDEDLITQRPAKRRATTETDKSAAPKVSGQPQTSGPGGLPRRHDSVMSSSESDIVFLRDLLAKQERDVARQINKKVEQHDEWNAKHIDLTEDILRGVLDRSQIFLRSPDRFVDALKFAALEIDSTGQLPTPPPSNPASSDDEDSMDVDSDKPKRGLRFHQAADIDRADYASKPHVRLRRGRLNRLFLDVHNVRSNSKNTNVDERMADRFKYDHDDGDETSEDDAPNDKLGLRGFYSRSRWFNDERERELLNEQRSRERMAQRRASLGTQPAPPSASSSSTAAASAAVTQKR